MSKKSVAFYPPFTTARPKHSLPGLVRTVNRDGTVNIVAEDGHGTPYENVPFLKPADAHPANGPFAVDIDPAAAVAAAPAAKPKRAARAKPKAAARKKAKKS